MEYFMLKPMPVIFFGHGSPMNALSDNVFTRKWAEIGKTIPRPKAVLCISAHWYVPFTAVTAMEKPPTIHDFGGFPRELFEFEYPAPGAPKLAERVSELLSPVEVGLDNQWGLDHGTWSVLCHVFPAADIPVVQLSIDKTKPPEFHYELAKRLAPLRDEGILITGNGNIVHNLRFFSHEPSSELPFDWAGCFDNQVRQAVISGNHETLISYEAIGKDAKLSVPTPEHYLPLLYVLGMQREGDEIGFPVEGFDGGGSISMLSVQIG
jgi:4,5-DOPA dioxygenase extradiol